MKDLTNIYRISVWTYNSLFALECKSCPASFHWMHSMKPVCDSLRGINLLPLYPQQRRRCQNWRWCTQSILQSRLFFICIYHYDKLAGLTLTLMSHFMLHTVSWELEKKNLRRGKTESLRNQSRLQFCECQTLKTLSSKKVSHNKMWWANAH